MIQVRSNTFETNSSSSHSIVLLNKLGLDEKEYFKCWLNKNGLFEIWNCEDLEFGRYPFSILSTFADKVRYAIACYGKSRFEEIEDLCIKYATPKYYDYYDIEAIDYCTGIKLPNDEWKDEKYYGGIDHQSMGLLDNTLNKLGITLEEFLINPRYVVIIDGDEYQIFDKMFECGIIDNSTVEKRFD